MRRLLTNTSNPFHKVKAAGALPVNNINRSFSVKLFENRLFTIVTGFLFLCLSPINCISKESNNILILLSGNNDVYLDVATTITNSTIKQCRNSSLSCQDTNFEISQVNSFDENLNHKYRLVVTLGIKAAMYANDKLADSIVLSALIPKKSTTFYSPSAINPDQYYLYLDQPLHRSLLLIKALSDRFKSVGILLNTNDESSMKLLTTSADKLNFALGIEKINSTEQIGASLNRLLFNVDIMLAVPDTYIHNKSTVSNILLSTYRNRIPLIGFSSAYVKAGALAAIYSSPEDIAFQVRDNIIDIYSDNAISNRTQMAKYFSILFNSEVARSLGFPIKSVTKLKEEIIKRSSDDIE
ncbi:MAG: hypothetical protein KZQ90_18645 [Candidatus Thiodiazotropha sp. (ex Codakia rugifera)]|nr:hypothetical protein [Candidatus Thiodiazotropha sp. (ex Codakia rugifera)]